MPDSRTHILDRAHDVVDRSRIECSVIIPSAGSCSQLADVLRSLEQQTIDSSRYELIVVDNNQDADASRRLTASVDPFDVRLAQARTPGPAAARNEGARVARGRVLIFVDDDIVVTSNFIELHIGAHVDGRGAVAVGRIEEHNTGAAWFRRYLVDEQVVNRVPDTTRLSFRNVYGANLSMRREEFVKIAGFDEAFRRREDEELGFRLIATGLAPTYLAEAVGRHYSDLSARAHIRRSDTNGYYLAMLISRHPTVASFEKMRNYSPWLRYASLVAAPFLLVAGTVLYPITSKVLHRGLTACVLVQNSRGFARYRRAESRRSDR